MIDLEAIRTLADIPAAQARVRGAATAVKFGERETSFAELDARSNRVAHALLAAGLEPGDRVSALTKNHDSWYPLFFGTARARACFAPINCRLAPAEIGFILGDAGPKLLFVGEDFFECALSAVGGLASAPRLIALLISLPLLTFLAGLSALFGGLLVAWGYGGISPEIFLARLQNAIGLNTFLVGLIKAPFMALVIGVIACLEGFRVQGSAESLGRQVTASVVKAIFMVIVVDGMFAMFFAAIKY